MTQYYEPPALVDKLKPGTRVRVRVSPECDLECSKCHQSHHENVLTGELGTITSIDQGHGGFIHRYTYEGRPTCGGTYPINGHRFFVAIDRIGVIADLGTGGNWFAAVELEPLEDGEVDG